MSRGPGGRGGRAHGRRSRAGELPPELEAAAFALAAGETSDVVETPLGYHVLRVDARRPARAADPGGVRATRSATQLLAQKRRGEAEREFVAGLLARAKVNHEAAHAHSCCP